MQEGKYLPIDLFTNLHDDLIYLINFSIQQVPHIPPQPFVAPTGGAVSPQAEAVGEQYGEPFAYQSNPLRFRPPAMMYVGKPVRPGKLRLHDKYETTIR